MSLEPEAAFIFCQYALNVKDIEEESNLDKETAYMIVDLGGIKYFLK